MKNWWLALVAPATMGIFMLVIHAITGIWI